MPQIVWTESLVSGLGAMDETHQGFVASYNALASASPEDFLARFDELIAHTRDHFDQENRWMDAVNFPGCHRSEHDRVMAVVADVRKRVAQGDIFLGKRLVEELPAWFESHVSGMDAALVFHLESIGFDIATGTLPAEAMSRHGGSVGSGCACALPDDSVSQPLA